MTHLYVTLCTQCAVEVTCCIATLLHDDYNLELDHHDRERLLTKMTNYTGLPPSDIIFASNATPRRMFIALYDKYKLFQSLRAKYLRHKETERQQRRYHTRRNSVTIDLPEELSINDILRSPKSFHNFADEDKSELGDIVRSLELMMDSVTKRLGEAIDALKKRREFTTWYTALDDDDKETIIRAVDDDEMYLSDQGEIVMDRAGSRFAEWTCNACGCRNRWMWLGNDCREPQSDCICCGTDPNNQIMENDTQSQVTTDKNVLMKWSELKADLADDPNNEACNNDWMIDSCHKVQILWFFMECYMHYIGAAIGEDEERYQIESMHILVNRLLKSEKGMDELIMMFDHVYSKHFKPALFDLYREREVHDPCHQQDAKDCQFKPSTIHQRTFPSVPSHVATCHSADCSMHRRNRRRPDRRSRIKTRDNAQGMVPCTVDVGYVGQSGCEIEDPKERQAMMLFDQWHSSFCHPVAPVHQDQPVMPSALQINMSRAHSQSLSNSTTQHKFCTDANLAKAATEQFSDQNSERKSASSKYHQYGFGKQIKYHKESPGFSNLKEELMNNEVHRITLQSWTGCLERALLLHRCFADKYVAVAPNPETEEEYEHYGVKTGDRLGIENIIAIVIYCDFHELQSAFSRTFRKIEENDTLDDIRQRHCRNFYWLGRYVTSNWQ